MVSRPVRLSSGCQAVLQSELSSCKVAALYQRQILLTTTQRIRHVFNPMVEAYLRINCLQTL